MNLVRNRCGTTYSERRKKVVNSIEVNIECIKKELRYLSGEVNHFIMCIKETECVELKELYAHSLFEYRGRLGTVIALIENGTEYTVIRNYGENNSVKSIHIKGNGEEIIITPQICIEIDDNGDYYLTADGKRLI